MAGPTHCHAASDRPRDRRSAKVRPHPRPGSARPGPPPADRPAARTHKARPAAAATTSSCQPSSSGCIGLVAPRCDSSSRTRSTPGAHRRNRTVPSGRSAAPKGMSWTLTRRPPSAAPRPPRPPRRSAPRRRPQSARGSAWLTLCNGPRRIRTTSERGSSGYGRRRRTARRRRPRGGVEHDLPAAAHLVGRQAERYRLVEGVHQHDEAVVELLPAAGRVEQLAGVAAQTEARGSGRPGSASRSSCCSRPSGLSQTMSLDRRCRGPAGCGRSGAGGRRGGCGAAGSAAARMPSGTGSASSHLIQDSSLSWQ